MLRLNASCPDVFVWRRKADKQIMGRHHGFVRDLFSAVCNSLGDVALNDVISE